jgi:hypothetical protein
MSMSQTKYYSSINPEIIERKGSGILWVDIYGVDKYWVPAVWELQGE